MKKMLMTETKGEAEKVQALFEEITKAIADGKKDYDANCYCDETDTFTDHLEFGVDIPRGAIVYVFRDIGGGEAVWDIYKFGYCGEYAVSKDNEGDVAGLVNAGLKWFPF